MTTAKHTLMPKAYSVRLDSGTPMSLNRKCRPLVRLSTTPINNITINILSHIGVPLCLGAIVLVRRPRSEERRVGKECCWRGRQRHEKREVKWRREVVEMNRVSGSSAGS